MKKHSLFLFWIVLVFGLIHPLNSVRAQTTAAPDRPVLTLKDIHASAQFYGRFFEGGRWAGSGPVVTFVESEGASTNLMSFNLETGERKQLIDGSKLVAADVGRAIRIEDYQFAPDGNTILLFTDTEPVWRLNTKGFYYLYDIKANRLTPISDRSKGFQMFAKLSPDTRYVAFVRDRNLFLVDLSSMKEVPLTSDGSEGGIINGTTDWVYEEEFGLRDAWAWSPDGRYIAFLQLDETRTRPFQMADLRPVYPESIEFRYPKAGEANSEVRVGVVSIPETSVSFFDTGAWQAGGDSLEYIPQLGWTPMIDGAHYVWMFRMDRDQNDLDVLYADPKSGKTRRILKEKEQTWIDVETGFSDLDVGSLTYLPDGKHFVWTSSRDGYRHLYLYENSGRFLRQLTRGNWDVTDFHGIDQKAGQVYFTATIDSPLERHFYRVRYAEKPSEAVSSPQRISTRPGWHDINMSRDLNYYIDSFSNAVTPTVVSLHRADGTQINVLEGNEALAGLMQRYDLPPPEFLTVPGADGTPLNAYIIKPRDFDPSKKYRLLMHVYGGPGSQEVRNQWGGPERIWHHMLAEQFGILVAGVDNRGTAGRGKAFQGAVYKQLGILEAQDQIAAAKYFGNMAYVDASHIGIWGWSYGGFMTLMSMLTDDGPRTFRLGVAVAPVSDWRLYDTIYTERFMSTPQNNAGGYDLAAPVRYADRLADNQKLLIIHGDADDNVHYQNTVQMIDALQQANKQFSMMVYPGRNHGIYGGMTRLHLYGLITEFVKNNL